MTTCLQHAEVLLPAGWMPVMTRGEWTFPELEHDTAVCLKLTIEEVAWTLEGFFGERVSDSRPGTYTLDDLLDIVELIRVRRMNEARASDAVRA